MLAYRRLLGSTCLILTLALSLTLVACGDPEADEAALADQQRRDEFQQLEVRKEQLDAKREQLADLRAEQDAPVADEDHGENGDAEAAEPARSAEVVQAEITALEQEIDSESQQLYSDIVTFFNANAPNEGEDLNEMQRSIVRMKSDEDIRMADEYILQAGDYERAINIYQDAQQLDPDNPLLEEAIADAQDRRYVDQERFDQIKKGMTEGEVRGILGRAQRRNVRDYEDQGVTAWFYPKSPQRDAAAVWFREQGGQLKVYKLDYDAVAAQAAEEEDAT
jgi:hypothetical protein